MNEKRIFADRVAGFIGSGTFIVGQLTIVIGYILYQTLANGKFDNYPFILLNLILSIQAAFTGPFVLWSQNKTHESDRELLNQIAEMVNRLDKVNINLEEIEESLEDIEESLDEEEKDGE
jgi:uncharacterized membrane protein